MIKNTKIRPLPGFVLIEPIEEEAKTVGGVYLPEVSKDKPMRGKIVAVGDQYMHESGKFQDVPVEKDQVVIYKKWVNQEVEHEGKTYLMVKFDELMGVVE